MGITYNILDKGKELIKIVMVEVETLVCYKCCIGMSALDSWLYHYQCVLSAACGALDKIAVYQRGQTWVQLRGAVVDILSEVM